MVSLTVPSLLDDSKHGHTWGITISSNFKWLTNSKVIQHRIPNPGTTASLAITDYTTATALNTVQNISDIDAFYTQKHVVARLQDLIVNIALVVPWKVLNNPDFLFTNTGPLTLIKLLRSQAEHMVTTSVEWFWSWMEHKHFQPI